VNVVPGPLSYTEGHILSVLFGPLVSQVAVHHGGLSMPALILAYSCIALTAWCATVHSAGPWVWTVLSSTGNVVPRDDLVVVTSCV
jgi:hypothetical protein